MEITQKLPLYGFFLALYLATQFLPEGKEGKLTIMMNGMDMPATLKRINLQNWQLKSEMNPKESPIIFQIDPTKHSLKTLEGELEDGVFLDKFFDIKKEKINWKKIKKLNPLPEYIKQEHTPIVIKKQQKSISFSQQKGILDIYKSIKITWD